MTCFIRKALSRDVRDVVSILRSAAVAMMQEGKCQWDESYPGECDVRADIQNGNGYVLEADGETVGYAAVIFDGEPAYASIDGVWLTDCDYGYVVVHRMAIRQDMLGNGYGKALLMAVEKMAKDKNIESFRIDTNYDNEVMLRLLTKMGFRYCGEIQYEKGCRLAFEKLLFI